MTPEELAGLHERAMDVPAPWNASDFTAFLSQPGVFLSYPTKQNPSAFALGRVVLDEAELLTLAVDPDMQRQGLGRACLRLFEESAARLGAAKLFLEVAETNHPARQLYLAAGWAEAGCRKAYYKSGHARIDAILMTKDVVGQAATLF